MARSGSRSDCDTITASSRGAPLRLRGERRGSGVDVGEGRGGRSRGVAGWRLEATGDSYLLGGRKSKRGPGAGQRRSNNGSDGDEDDADRDGDGAVPLGSVDPDAPDASSNVMTRLTAKDRVRYALKQVDSDGYWAVISSGIVFGTFLLESYNMSSFGGWDVLYRDDISWYTGLISMQDLIDIEDAYNVLFFFEFCLRAWAADFKKDFWTNPVTAVDFLATIPPVISFFGFIDRASPLFRFLRLLRVLRLLRLLDRSPKSVLFGLVRSDSMSIQLVGIGAEFICIFVIAAGVIYDLEYEINPNVNNLNDTLYWAILTLTGIGQPFEVVTAGGRVATVVSIAVALIVVPGQLAGDVLDFLFHIPTAAATLSFAAFKLNLRRCHQIKNVLRER